jgi:hypothetical protein
MKTFNWLSILTTFIALTLNAGATTYYVNATNPAPVAPFTNWLTAATNIQNAIDTATNGDLVLVTNGLFNTGGQVVASSGTGGGSAYGSPITNRVAINKAVTVRSVNGPVVTLIQGYHFNYLQTNSAGVTNFNSDVRGVYMTNNATLDGFTIFGSGGSGSGSGIYCESTNCLVTNCILSGNVSAGNGSLYHGAGAFQGTLNNCVLSNNCVPVTAWNYGVQGGGAYQSILNNCLIVSNSASFGGGVAYSTLNHCIIIRNSAPNYGSTSWGGGTYQSVANQCLIAGNYSATAGGGDCNGTLNSCILSNNMVGGNGSLFTGQGGGSYRGTLDDCLVISNVAYGDAGGYYGTTGFGHVCNSTIVGNSATNAYGGIYGSATNCIIYYNSCNSKYPTYNNSGAGASGGGYVISSCTTPMPRNYQTGDITNEPAFVNSEGGDFHLSLNSPCINAGNNSSVSSTNDLDGHPRIAGGTVDMGAYEFATPASVLSYAWALQYGLPVDGSADFADADGDGMNNWQEWLAGTIPTNAASCLQMLSTTNSVTGPMVTWQSVSGKTYFMQRSTNLAAQPAFSSIQSNLTGQAGTTRFTDTTATNGNSFFYRVGVQ